MKHNAHFKVVALQTDNTGKIAWDAVIKHKSAGDSNHLKTHRCKRGFHAMAVWRTVVPEIHGCVGGRQVEVYHVDIHT